MSKRFLSFAFLLASVSLWAQTAERYIVFDGVGDQARVFNASNNAEIATIRTGSVPNSGVISPNGRLAFVGNADMQYVSVLDLTIQAEIKRIRNVGQLQIAMSPDGTRLLSTHGLDEGITLIDATNLSVIKTVDLNGQGGDDPTVEDLNFNNPVIFGNTAYLNTNFDIIAVDLTTFAVTPLSGPDDAFFFQGAENLAITPDGKTLAAIRAAGLVLFDTATNKPITTVPFSFAFSVAAGPNPSNHSKMVAYVANAGNSGPVLSVVDLSRGSFGKIIAEIPLPPEVLESQRSMLTMNPSGTRVYLNVSRPTLSSENDVFIIDTSALLHNPAAAIVHESSVPLQARAMAVGVTQNQPPATAPVITSIDQAEVTNDHSVTLNVFGSGFAPGAQVRIGSLDPIAGKVLSPTHLSVVLPANAPTQIASIIVTNPNSSQALNAQQQSGILHDALTIAVGPGFMPQNEAVIEDFGDLTLSLISGNNVDGLVKKISTGPRPGALAITPDGTRAYFADGFSPVSVQVFNFTTNQTEANIVLNGDPTSLEGDSKGIVFAPRLGTGKLAAYVVASKTNNLDLYAIDADPSSPTFNTLIDDIPTNISTASNAPGSLAMTPDGRFAFIDELDFNDGANLVIIDLATRAITVIPASTLDINPFQLTMEISSDGKFLVCEGPLPEGDPFLVFDITQPANPVSIATIHGAVSGQPRVILEFPRIVGDKLFSWDNDDGIVTIFNFKPANHDFSQIGSFLVPASSEAVAAVPDVTPDGKLMYIPLREDDAVAVIDVAKVLANDPSALITKIGTGLSPDFVVVRPATTNQ